MNARKGHKWLSPVVLLGVLIFSVGNVLQCEGDAAVSSTTSTSDTESSDDSESDTTSSTTTTTTASASLSFASATLSSASDLEKQNSDAEVSLKVSGSNVLIDSCESGGKGANYGIGTDAYVGSNDITKEAFTYQPSAAVQVKEIDLEFSKFGSPTGDLYVEIASDNAGEPGTVLGTSGDTAANSSYQTFTFASAVSLSASTTYHIVLRGQANYFAGSDASNRVRQYYNDSCTNNGSLGDGVFGDHKYYQLLGPAWNTSTAGKSPLPKIRAVGYASGTPYVEVTFDPGREVEFDLSTFTAAENPNSEAGSITYDLGVSSDGTAAYSIMGKTKAQVIAYGSPLSGRYLHVKVYLSGSGIKDATIGAMTMSYSYSETSE